MQLFWISDCSETATFSAGRGVWRWGSRGRMSLSAVKPLPALHPLEFPPSTSLAAGLTFCCTRCCQITPNWIILKLQPQVFCVFCVSRVIQRCCKECHELQLFCQFKLYSWDQSFTKSDVLVVALMHSEHFILVFHREVVCGWGRIWCFLCACMLFGVFLFFHLILSIQQGWQSWGTAFLDQQQEHRDHVHAAQHTPLPQQLHVQGEGGAYMKEKTSLKKGDINSWIKKNWRVCLLGFNGAVPGKQQRTKCFQDHIIQE